ncbi:MAG: efflux RND transporter periplasmic adaptor subunit [Armatimonadota bacterium]
MKGNSSLFRIAIPILMLVVIAVVGLLVRNRFSSINHDTGMETATVTRRTLNATVLATGSVKSIVGTEVKVGSRISGVVTHLPVNIGSLVRKGQLISQLDDREVRSQVDQARSNLAAAQSRLAELEAGYSAHVVQSKTDIERANSNLAAARSRLSQARTSEGTVPLEVTAQIQQASASVDQAEASRKNAKTKLNRMENLLAKDFIARQDVDNALTEYEVADSQVRHAQAVLAAAKANSSQMEIKKQDVAQAEEGLRQAKSALSMARANVAQVRVKEEAIRTARAQVAQARAALRYAETQLSYTRIVSPVNGVIASVSTQEGETIAAGLQAPTFVTIVDLSKLQVDALVDETDIGRVKVGDSAAFTVDSYPDEEFEGRVTAIYPKAIIDQNVVNYDVVVTITNPRGMLRPDMTANVTVNIATKNNVLAVPNKAIKHEEGTKIVYVIENGKPVRRRITTGWKDSDYTEITSGFREGERVVVGDIPGSAREQSGAAQSDLPPGATGK